MFYFYAVDDTSCSHLGFNESEAELLVNQTFMGSVAIQNSYSFCNQVWIAKVASKGGTTESALSVFENGYLEKTIVVAVKASNDRALELGT